MRYNTAPKEIDCSIPPEGVCLPNQWQGMPYDSSYEVNKFLDSYYTFEKVQQINTIDNDWALSFFDNRNAALMYDESNVQKVMMVRMIKHNKGTIDKGLGIPMSGHTGAMTIKEKDIIFSVSPTEGMLGRAKLYEGNLVGNYVSEIKSLGSTISQNDFTWESHPSISSDGKVLFFASDRIVGFGGTDIWFSVRQSDGSWSRPINCGAKINTGCHEISPFIDISRKKLLFSSTGHETVGGYDIFSVDISDEFWLAVKANDLSKLQYVDDYFSAPKNLRPPLNTIHDELFPSSPGNVDSILYYSSNQDADRASLISMEGGFDIFVRKLEVRKKDLIAKDKKKQEDFIPDVKVDIKMEEPKFEIEQTFILEGTVFHGVTLEELEEAEVSITKMPEKAVYKEIKTDKYGKYQVKLEKEVQYDILAQAKDLFFESASVFVESFDTVKVLKQDFKIPEMLTLRINFPTNVHDNPYRYILDTNGVESSDIWEIQMDILAQNIIKSVSRLKKIQLIGHTDDVGTDSYNIGLAKRRVEFVISELIKRGVPEDILEGKSAGKSKPLLNRQGEDTEMWRKRLRRVELQKIWNN
jgi:hypothetical protein